MAKTYDVEAQMIKLQLALLKLPVEKWYKGDKFAYSRTYDYVVIQNGKVLGTVTYEKNSLTKKNFPGLKAGLFSSELKGVTVFCVEKILNLGQHMEKMV